MKKILILAGASAVGKTTVAKQLLDVSKEFTYARSATTREKRGDGNDSEYVYLSKEEFKAAIDNGQMLEFTEYAGNFYGTLKAEIDEILSTGRIPLLVLDLEGVRSVKSFDKYSSYSVYLYDDPNVLEERLYARYLGDKPTIEGLSLFVSRKEQNIEELQSIKEKSELFDLVTRNSDLDKTVSDILRTFSDDTSVDNTAAFLQIENMLEEKLKRNKQ